MTINVKSADIDRAWWQAHADRLGETLLVMTTREPIQPGAKPEPCIHYGVTESVATAWEKDNAAMRLIPSERRGGA